MSSSVPTEANRIVDEPAWYGIRSGRAECSLVNWRF
uniref:Uncharacterized protein n=1 Tax=Nelumbo nucifera TaxID=4432 RepID=A0A822XP16_NELNU|nr:TPA_asm: hypothetical protein HUJ06_023613 [Nelumbo nucifera]